MELHERLSLAGLRAWRDTVSKVAASRGEEMFMGKPEAWYDRPHWFCPKGHVSTIFLKCEVDGDQCLVCRQPVVLGPPMTEDDFAPVAAALACANSASRELDALRADKARLDYLDRCNAALNERFGTTYRWELILNHNVNRLMLGHLTVDLNDSAANGLPSCRDAIDKRMRETAEKAA